MRSLLGLYVDSEYTQGWSRPRVAMEIAGIFASTDFDYFEMSGRVSLSGPQQRHLNADPELGAICDSLGISLSNDSELFHKSKGSIDLCLEDGLSGWFLSRVIFGGPTDTWVVLHIDDHADMMPTLLAWNANDGLHDPETGTMFCARTERDWHRAMARGTVTIGNYLTPLFHQMPAGGTLHIRHLRPKLVVGSSEDIFGVTATARTYPVFGPTRFAALDLTKRSASCAGTYRQSESVGVALDALPSERVIVHIDLDYFVNDFNGNPGAKPKTLGERERSAILTRMDRIFERIAHLKSRVERWVIATSPGFCAARHWTWLLDELNARISALTGEAGPLIDG